ncbi:MAG: DUF3999 domain-containing protein [Desulfobulbaceae bacterium]|nr:DUF3999 domain-containing protein [Desulfobulbaceae bacterium]
MNIKLFILLLWVECIFAAILSAAEITPDDFARGFYLEVVKKGAVYSLELPEDVYLTVQDAFFKDVAVFNGAGEQIVHGIEPIEPESGKLREQQPIPFFPLTRGTAEGSSLDLAMHVDKTQQGTIIKVETGPLTTPFEEHGQVGAYLLDLSSIELKINHLEFLWGEKEGDSSSIYTVNIEESSDLQTWTPLVTNATLADLVYGDQRVERRIVKLKRQPKQYLKVSWKEGDTPLLLTGVNSYSRLIKSAENINWVALKSAIVEQDEQGPVLQFQSDYSIQVNSVQLALASTNSLVPLVVQSRKKQNDVWIQRCEQLFFKLSVDQVVLENEPCFLKPNVDRFWQVTAKDHLGERFIEQKNLSLMLGRSPVELSFLAQGEPPYLLAYGSGKVSQLDGILTANSISELSAENSLSRIRGTVLPGERVKLGGESALKFPPGKKPWRQWLLWSVLLAGVGFLAYMVKKLVSEMQRESENKVPHDTE